MEVNWYDPVVYCCAAQETTRVVLTALKQAGVRAIVAEGQCSWLTGNPPKDVHPSSSRHRFLSCITASLPLHGC